MTASHKLRLTLANNEFVEIETDDPEQLVEDLVRAKRTDALYQPSPNVPNLYINPALVVMIRPADAAPTA